MRREAQKALEAMSESFKKENSDNEKNGETGWEEPPLDGGVNSLTLSSNGTAGGVSFIELDNEVPVTGGEFHISGANPTDVRTTDRTEGFFAKLNEKDGTVILLSLSGDKIAPGTGPIVEIISDGDVNLSDYTLTDKNNTSIEANNR